MQWPAQRPPIVRLSGIRPSPGIRFNFPCSGKGKQAMSSGIWPGNLNTRSPQAPPGIRQGNKARGSHFVSVVIVWIGRRHDRTIIRCVRKGEDHHRARAARRWQGLLLITAVQYAQIRAALVCHMCFSVNSCTYSIPVLSNMLTT